MSIQEEIKAFVDGELSPQLTESVRNEIERDPALAQQAAHYRLMSDAIREMAIEPKVAGAESALQRLQPRSLGRRLAIIAVPVAIALVASVLFPVFAQAKFAAKSVSAFQAVRAMSAARRPMEAFKEDRAVGATSDTTGTVTSAAAAPQAPVASDGAKFALKRNFASMAKASAPAMGGVGGAGGFGMRSMRHGLGAPGGAGRARASAAPPVAARMVVESGTLEMVVDDVPRAQSEAMNYAKSIGGFSSSSSLDTDSDSNVSSAELTLRVPVARFEAAMEHLKKMAKSAADIKAVHVTGEDVTGQYADTTARVKVLRAEEDSYVQMLRNTRHLDDVLTVKDRLSDVRQQIESLQTQASTLADTSALSTIEITFRQRQKPAPKPAVVEVVPTDAGWANAAWTDAKSGMADATRVLGTWSIYLVVYSPLWIPLAFLGWLAARKWI
jgi:hypothetical protein